ncbi:MAG: ABC transporter permease [Saprospiraceae bacterium]|nr:ABC transporter permease [Saprospiraceae bacterium]
MMRHTREKSRVTIFSQWFVRITLGGFLLTAIFANYMANELPIFTQKGGKTEWPIFHPEKYNNLASISFADYDRVIYPVIPFNHQYAHNLDERLVPPGSQTTRNGMKFKHILGTDRLGRDVAAGLVFGCRKSIYIAFLSALISLLIGMLLGGAAGYWGNNLKIQSTWYFLIWMLLVIYGIYCVYYDLLPGLLVVILVAFAFLPNLYFRDEKSKYFRLPADFLVIKLIETIQSIPGLIILLVVAAIVRSPSLTLLAVIISLIRWTGFARFIRAEVIKIKARDYITAAKISGLSNWKIATKYILPEAFGPLIVVFAFGVSSVILLESTLSFLGIGLPVNEVTWGTLLGQAKQNPNAWWLALFPGLCILLLVLSLNLIGDQLKRRFDVRD